MPAQDMWSRYGPASGINNMTDLLEKTKVKYNSIHPDDKRWPCPFCLSKEKTLFQCKVHKKKDHPNLMRINEREILSQYENSFENNSSQSKESENISTKDLKDFLELLNETNVEDQDNSPNTDENNLAKYSFVIIRIGEKNTKGYCFKFDRLIRSIYVLILRSRLKRSAFKDLFFAHVG
ncbi:hypothetical protein Bhyg_14788 [Pseudolycoriella hygida]|uniref:Uncharacterized protein n=1 Tax=Pseudolycoriella hygida TaxID=35572 RepID=A0A9Q0MQM3_9DIPT|nr:hypothetical protein Bhyg_14788 [Pseudolycoriella hygida]